MQKTIDQLLRDAAARVPQKTAVVAYRGQASTPSRLSYSQLDGYVDRCARALARMGIEPGDVVGIQLPNWWEFVVLSFACARVGAVTMPLGSILRERELRYILEFSQAKIFVVPSTFKGFNYRAMAYELASQIGTLERVVVVDGDGDDSFSRMLLSSDDSGVLLQDRSKPDDLTVLMFTSGTTGSPKGVMHRAESLLACAHSQTRHFGFQSDEVLFGASPVGHMTGYEAAMLLAVYLAGTVVLVDVWDPRHSLEVMSREGVTFMPAATPFLADICNAVAAGCEKPRQLRAFMCGGAPIPPVLIEQAADILGVNVCSMYGMTETLTVTLTEPDRAAEKSAKTDGRVFGDMEIRILDETGSCVPTGVTGRLWIRGAHMALGYYRRPDIQFCDSEGWFDSGDLAYMDDEGYIRINGRIKDVIIRGGENIPVVELEDLLYKHPAVKAVAIVGYPDPRLGERACACIELRQNCAMDLRAVQQYFADCKVTKQYWPERVHIVDELPRTASGKIQKYALQEKLRLVD